MSFPNAFIGNPDEDVNGPPTTNGSPRHEGTKAFEGDSVNEESNGVLDLEKIKRSWDAITHAISREKMSVATFLQEGSPFELKGAKLIIGFSKEDNFHKESLEHKDNLKLVEKVFSEKLKTRINIGFKIVENYKPQDDEPLVKRALETFKGKVVSKWHRE